MTETPAPPPEPPPNRDANSGAPVRDLRVQPKAIIPRKAATVLLTVAAGGLAAIVLFFGGGAEVQQRAAAVVTPPTATDPQRLKYYETQLRQAPVAQPVIPPSAVDVSQVPPPRPVTNQYVDVPAGYTTTAPKPVDQIAEDRKRRDYDSLFSSNVVLSKRGSADALVAPTLAPSATQPPSLDAVTQSVMRAMGPPPGSPLGTQASQPAPHGLSAAPTQPTVGRPTAGPATNLHRLYEGTVIDAVLANRLDGSGIAPVRAMVTNDVYAQDMTRVIPAGAMVLGTASAVQGFGQSRLAVAFHRIIGQGIDISLDQFVGLNIRGDAGLKDKTDNHYLSIFGAAAAVGLIGGLSQAVGGAFGRDNTTIVLGGSSDATSQAAAQVMQRFSNQVPTVTIREGHRLKVYVTSDLDLPEALR